MIPTIKDQDKRSRLIKSIAPILEESLDSLIHGLKTADSDEELKKVVSTTEQTELLDHPKETVIKTKKAKTTNKKQDQNNSVIRRKKKIKHEKQKGDHIERLESETHEEQDNKDNKHHNTEHQEEETEVTHKQAKKSIKVNK